MSKPVEKLRVIMMAPQRVTGGIATWLRILLKASNTQRVEYRVIDTSRLYLPHGVYVNFVGAILGARDATFRLLRLLWTVATFRPHLVYLTCAPSIGFVARQCAYLMILRALGVPTVIHLRGGKVKGFFGGSFLRRWVARAGTRCASAVFAITRPVEQAAVEIAGRQKVFYVPSMFDDDALGSMPPHQIDDTPPSGSYRLLHVGWQDPEKGSLDLIEAVSHLQSPVVCNLVGACAEKRRSAIDGLISRLDLGRTVHLPGIKTGRELAEYFEKADLFVFPSHSEGFPMAVLEAMAYGLPIVATDVGNIREMIGADTDAPAGVVLDKVNPVDPRELARKIDELIASPSLRRTMSQNGMRRARDLYAAGKVVPQLEEMIERIARPPERSCSQLKKWHGHLAHGSQGRPAPAAFKEECATHGRDARGTPPRGHENRHLQRAAFAAKKPGERLRVIMLAPTGVPGGITTWWRFLRQASNPQRVEYRVIDTSKMFDPLGKKLNIFGSVLGARDATKRLGNLLWTIHWFRPHLVYFTCAPSLGFAVRDCPYLILLRLLGVPAVIHLHGGKAEGFFGGGAVRRWVVRAGARCARAVLVITRVIEKAAVDLVGRQKVFYVPNMIGDDVLAAIPARPAAEAPASEKARLLHVAWQAEEKGSLDLVGALSHVQSPVDCNLVGICADENRRMIDGLISQLNLGQTVRLAGLKKGRELAGYFEQADLFVFPSHFEGFPMAVLEAMAYGLPIVATDVGNIREMIGADTDAPAGVVLDKVNPVDPRELAGKIDGLIASPALRRTMSQNGMSRARKLYPASKVVPELEELLERIAGGECG